MTLGDTELTTQKEISVLIHVGACAFIGWNMLLYELIVFNF